MSNFNFQAVVTTYFNEDRSRAIYCDPNMAGLWSLVLIDGEGMQWVQEEVRENRKDAEAWMNEPLATC